ncbi:uncharacterized protein LOC103717897 [Phoenix dactylifera]|uniref:Uncharacterized protein LOC103717897 n=1 Tax=Phoenix dactylifera TaxID=42345 RepID=A0A8B7CRZ5_PHODC|nr:uncharacterized protein LOC103717897 [Phoenix dactylifera]WCF34210.1 late embryonic abundant protein 2.6 [Phoenix dactylifera]
MKESGDSTTNRRGRRRRLICCGGCLLLLIVLGVVVVVLYFTLFRPREPTIQIVSTRVAGVSPRVTLPAVRIEINMTLDIDVLVHNPNRASFDHGQGHTILRYRGTQVGDADVAPGRVAQRGDSHVHLKLRVLGDRLTAQLGSFLADVAAGELPFDSSTRVPGRITFLGFIKFHAVAKSECNVVIGVPDLGVKSQDCTQKTKL